MSHTPHDLHSEFPDATDALHSLKEGNPHFGKLAEQYHDLNREIHRIDSGIEPASDDRTEQLKKERLAILDQVAMMIADLGQ
jgi:uncharacterized protein